MEGTIGKVAKRDRKSDGRSDTHSLLPTGQQSLLAEVDSERSPGPSYEMGQTKAVWKKDGRRENPSEGPVTPDEPS